MTGWYVAVGILGGAALLNSRRPGEMTEERDRIYRDCLSGSEPVEKMRKVAAAFEKARCFPQARMLRQRIALLELPPEIQEQRKQNFEKGMKSTNRAGILRLADAFDREGATTSARKLREHALSLPNPLEAKPIVTPPPQPIIEERVSDVRHSNGKVESENVGLVQETSAVAN